LLGLGHCVKVFGNFRKLLEG